MSAKLNVTLKRSAAGRSETQRRTLQALGLRRINQTVTVPDEPGIRGQIAKVSHLVEATPASE